MAAQKEMDDILALASELDMDVTEDEQGESWMGTGGVLTPSAVPVASSKDGLDISRRVLSGSTDSSPVGLFVYDTQAGVEGPCGGTIGGVSGRFCCVPESACTVQSHSQKRFGAMAGHAYIRCPRGTAAYCFPSLNLDSVALEVKDALEDKNFETVQAWTMMFEGLMLNRNETAEVQLDVVVQSSQKVSWVSATPRKRKGVRAYEEAPADGFEDVKDFPISEPVQKMRKILEDSIEVVDAKVMEIRGALGSTPADDMGLPCPQVWPCLVSLSSEVLKVHQLESDTGGIRAQLGELVELRAANRELIANMLAMKEEQAKLRVLTSTVTRLVVRGGGNGGAGTIRESNDDTIVTLRNDVTQLKNQVNVLQRSLAETRARGDGQGVRLGDKVYHSPLALKEWVVKHRADTLPMDVWSDCISMFEQLTVMGVTSEKRTATQTTHRKAGHESVEMGILINSFGTGVPAIFQKPGVSSKGMSTVTVADSFEEWDRGDGRTGLADNIEVQCNLWNDNLTSTISSMTVAVQATIMQTASRGFWIQLRSWISAFHGRLVSSATYGPNSGQGVKDFETMLASMKKEAWSLICQVLQDIFADFLRVRSRGNPAVNMAPGPLRTATVIFGLLKGQEFMRELLMAQIERHPCLSPSLNNFCIANRASLGEVHRVEAKANHAIKLHDALKA